MCTSAALSGMGNAHDAICTLCKLMGCNLPGGAMAAAVTTIDLAMVDQHKKGVALLAGTGAAHTQLHVTPDGGQLVSSVAVTGNEVKAPLQGSIAGIPFDLDLVITLDTNAKQIRVKLNVRQPIAFSHEWVYSFGTFMPVANGWVASGLQLEAGSQVSATAAASGINFLCILKCGGLKLLPVLATCLPSLFGGVPAFVGCVALRAGSAAAEIAQCIAKDCLKA